MAPVDNSFMEEHNKLSWTPFDTPCPNDAACKALEIASSKCNYGRLANLATYNAVNLAVHVFGVMTNALCGCIHAYYSRIFHVLQPFWRVLDFLVAVTIADLFASPTSSARNYVGAGQVKHGLKAPDLPTLFSLLLTVEHDLRTKSGRYSTDPESLNSHFFEFLVPAMKDLALNSLTALADAKDVYHDIFEKNLHDNVLEALMQELHVQLTEKQKSLNEEVISSDDNDFAGEKSPSSSCDGSTVGRSAVSRKSIDTCAPELGGQNVHSARMLQKRQSQHLKNAKFAAQMSENDKIKNHNHSSFSICSG